MTNSMDPEAFAALLSQLTSQQPISSSTMQLQWDQQAAAIQQMLNLQPIETTVVQSTASAAAAAALQTITQPPPLLPPTPSRAHIAALSFELPDDRCPVCDEEVKGEKQQALAMHQRELTSHSRERAHLLLCSALLCFCRLLCFSLQV